MEQIKTYNIMNVTTGDTFLQIKLNYSIDEIIKSMDLQKIESHYDENTKKWYIFTKTYRNHILVISYSE